jgi:hypothetical protein
VHHAGVRQNILMEGENLPIDAKLLHNINIKLVFTLEIYLKGISTRLLFRLTETLLGRVVHTKA